MRHYLRNYVCYADYNQQFRIYETHYNKQGRSVTEIKNKTTLIICTKSFTILRKSL